MVFNEPGSLPKDGRFLIRPRLFPGWSFYDASRLVEKAEKIFVSIIHPRINQFETGSNQLPLEPSCIKSEEWGGESSEPATDSRKNYGWHSLRHIFWRRYYQGVAKQPADLIRDPVSPRRNYEPFPGKCVLLFSNFVYQGMCEGGYSGFSPHKVREKSLE